MYGEIEFEASEDNVTKTLRNVGGGWAGAVEVRPGDGDR